MEQNNPLSDDFTQGSIVGKFGTEAGISGVATGSNVIDLITFVISTLAMGVAVSFLVQGPLSYYFSRQPGANLFDIGLAVPLASVYGIVFFSICYLCYIRKKQEKQ